MQSRERAVLIATEHGLVVATRRYGAWHADAPVLHDRDVTGVISREGVILAGTTTGVFRSDDTGDTWSDANTGLTSRHVRWLAYHPDMSDLEFAGTEPAGIFFSHDGGWTWQRCPEVDALRDRHGWFLPYSPEAGCVRGFAFHEHRGYAAVEVGGVLRSDDTGQTWRLAGGSTGVPTFDIPPAPLVFSDVHWIESHPASPDDVFAATAEGLYISTDGGEAWKVSYAGFYCRGVWVDPADANHIILSPADSVRQKNGRIEESRDRGQTWENASDGLDLPWPDRMVERFATMDGEIFAVTNDGLLYTSSIFPLHWNRILSDISGIRAVAEHRPA